MQTLEVTDEQHAFIQHLREELTEQVVGKYGHVRDQDAIQFLIDSYDGDLDLDADVQLDASSDAGDDAETVSFDESEDGDDGAGADGETEDDEDGGADADEDEAEDGEDAADDSDGLSEGVGDDGSASNDDMLDRMMNLLDTHDDKWEESPSGDYRYRVELPDGSTEDVQTKDDVRALLFKNY